MVALPLALAEWMQTSEGRQLALFFAACCHSRRHRADECAAASRRSDPKNDARMRMMACSIVRMRVEHTHAPTTVLGRRSTTCMYRTVVSSSLPHVRGLFSLTMNKA